MKTCLMVVFTFALIWNVSLLIFVKISQLSLKFSFKDYELSFKTMDKKSRKKRQEEYNRLKRNTEKNIEDENKCISNIKKALFFDSLMILIILSF